VPVVCFVFGRPVRHGQTFPAARSAFPRGHCCLASRPMLESSPVPVHRRSRRQPPSRPPDHGLKFGLDFHDTAVPFLPCQTNYSRLSSDPAWFIRLDIRHLDSSSARPSTPSAAEPRSLFGEKRLPRRSNRRTRRYPWAGIHP
jgi:hypothetical protein